MTTQTARTVFHADESFVDPETGEYILARIVEDVTGYYIAGRLETLELAQARAAELNAEAGLTDADVLEVRVASMRGFRS